MEDFKLTHELISESIKSLSSTLNILTKIKQQQKEKKDYEILSFVSPYGGINDVVFGKNHHGEFSPTGRFSDSTFSEFYMLRQPSAKIYSVRRLSDGEVFTLGDDFCLHPCTRTYTISSFRIDGNLLYINSNNDYPVTIPRLIKKHKEPLFTTEDGVPVYLDQRVWWVRKIDFELDFHDFYNGESWFPERFWYFSTKEAAKDWVVMNKPCLSLKEVYDILDPDKSSLVRSCEEISKMRELKQKAKSKL